LVTYLKMGKKCAARLLAGGKDAELKDLVSAEMAAFDSYDEAERHAEWYLRNLG